MKAEKIIQNLENSCPPMFALDWDNSGLLCGHKDADIKKIVVAVDATDDVVDFAIKNGADMIITHHPLILKGLKRVTDSDFIGKRILKLAENKIVLYSMHTNFDVAVMADEAADILDLSNRSILEETYSDSVSKEGIGRIGMLPKSMTLKECAQFVKNQFHIDNVMVFGPLNKKIDIVAVCPGSGKSVTDIAIRSGAQLLITGDIGHHTGIDCVSRGLCVIDASHYGLEKIFVDYIKDFLESAYPEIKILSGKQKEPFVVI